MEYLKIRNNGVLDIRLVSLMGGTTKSEDKYKIGQFGTGLKYAIAFCERSNIDYRIFCGMEEAKIDTERETISGIDFNIVRINGHRTSVTTRMGMEWKAWMIIREIWCNALDEGGAEKSLVSDLKGEDGATTFYIQNTPEIQDVLKEWDKYFLHDQEPISTSEDFSIYPGGNTLRIYKQGVLIHEEKKGDYISLFAYDVHDAEINELREFRGSISKSIANALAGANHKAAKYFLDNVTESSYESTVDLNWYIKWNKSWRETIGDAKLIYEKALEAIKARGISVEDFKYLVVPKNVYSVLTKDFEGIGALYAVQSGSEFSIHYDKDVESRVNQCFAILETCNYKIHEDLIFVYGFFEDKRTLAQVNIKDKTVCISATLLNAPLFQIVGMLIEENEHYLTHYNDESREFQQHFINLYTKELLQKNGVEL